MKSMFSKFNFAFEDDNGTGGANNSAVAEPESIQQPEDTTGLKTALEKERLARREMEKQFKQLQESVKGIDPEKYKQFEQLQKTAEEMNQREASIKSELETQYTRQIQEQQKVAQAAEQKYTDLLKRTQVEKAYQAASGRTGGADDGTTFFDTFYGAIANRMKLSDRGEIEVVDPNGVRLYSKKDAAKPMSPVEFFSELAGHAVYGGYFVPKVNPKGGGMTQSNGISFPVTQDTSNMNRAERLTLAREQKMSR